jgi:hypothetical protein
VNVYEALLIALGLFLVARRGLAGDARTLLLLEAVFLADVMLINGECVAADLATGALVSAASLLLAVVKTSFVLRVLDGGITGRAAISLVPPGVLVFALPLLFAILARARLLTPATAYAAWWAAALAIVLQGVLLRSAVASSAAVEPERRWVAEAFQRAATVALPASAMLLLVAWPARPRVTPSPPSPPSWPGCGERPVPEAGSWFRVPWVAGDSSPWRARSRSSGWAPCPAS